MYPSLIFFFINLALSLCLQSTAIAKATSFITWQGCSGTLQKSLIHELERLPFMLIKLQADQALEIKCLSSVQSSRPYGFNFSFGRLNEPDRLELSPILPLKPGKFKERAHYRLADLSLATRTKLWWHRGLIHALARRALKRQPTLISKRFKLINGWGETFKDALNLDKWGYARSEGQDSLEMDWLTSAEEIFAPANIEVQVGKGDNRVLCQEFLKVKSFYESFNSKPAPLPPRYCTDFWRWVESVGTLEIVWSAPTSRLISSFGHVSLLMRPHDAIDHTLSDTDTLFQFSGLTTGQEDSAKELLKIPLVLSFEPAKQAIERETSQGRDITRLPLNLNETERVWLLAALWGRLRRYHGEYSFVRHNCTSALAHLIELSMSEEMIETDFISPRLTYAPLGLISTLQRLNKLSLTGYLEPSRSKAINILKSKLYDEQPSADLNLNEAISAWKVHSSQPFKNTQAILEARYVKLSYYLQLYDLAPWRKIDVKPPKYTYTSKELLELKHQLFHIEKSAEAVAELLLKWQEMLSTQNESLESNIEDLDKYNRLLEHVEDELIRVKRSLYFLQSQGQTTRPPLQLDSTLHALIQTRAPSIEPSWGGEQAVEFSFRLKQAYEPSVALRTVLYEEQKGRARHAFSFGQNTRQILELAAVHHAQSTAFSLTPFRINSSIDTLVNRLFSRLLISFNLYLDALFSSSSPIFSSGLSAGLGTEIVNWSAKQGHLSLIARTQMRSDGVGILNAVELTTPIINKLSFNASLGQLLWGQFKPLESLNRLTLPVQNTQIPLRMNFTLQNEVFSSPNRSLWLSAGLNADASGLLASFISLSIY